MAEPFSSLRHELNQRIQGVAGQAAQTWGAQHATARHAIRESIKGSSSDWNTDDIAMLNDLSHPPRPFHRSVSISHTHDFGGWFSVPRPAQIGWDIEVEARIKDQIIERVCSKEEIAACPKKAFLWGAKEAFFKALEDEQPEVVTQLTIADWTAVAPDLWTWRGFGPRNGEGLLLVSQPWILAACLIP